MYPNTFYFDWSIENFYVFFIPNFFFTEQFMPIELFDPFVLFAFMSPFWYRRTIKTQKAKVHFQQQMNSIESLANEINEQIIPEALTAHIHTKMERNWEIFQNKHKQNETNRRKRFEFQTHSFVQRLSVSLIMVWRNA